MKSSFFACLIFVNETDDILRIARAIMKSDKLITTNMRNQYRIDHQVKIRGFRIELGEIESQLISHEDIKQTVVIAREDNDDNYLVAYYVAEKELKTALLKAHLAKNLPDYILPSYFIRLEEIPLTSNGKIDRKALPKPEGKIDIGIEYVHREMK